MKKTVHLVVNFPKYQAGDGGPIVSETYKTRKEVTKEVIKTFADQFGVPVTDVMVVSVEENDIA